VARTTDVSIWASQLKAGTLPPVCVKSGEAAHSKLTFEFVGPASGGWLLSAAVLALFLGPIRPGGRRARGSLPLTQRWRRTFLAFRGAAIATAVIAFVVLFSTRAAPPSWRPGWVGFAFGCIALCFVILAVYGGLKPKGYVYATPEGQAWVQLRDVHSNFANAIEAMQH
jgi:hypothetical protein